MDTMVCKLRQKLLRSGAYEYKGLQFSCNKNVFSPREFPSTKIFSDWGHKYIKNDSQVLEVGCGVGVLSVSIAKIKNCQVTATDLDKRAVENSRYNILLNGVDEKVECFESDIYSSLDQKKKRYNYILWNSAFMYTDVKNSESEQSIFYDTNYEAHRRYLNEAKDFLIEGGRIFLGFGHIGNERKLKDIAKELNLQCRVLEKVEIIEDDFSYDYYFLEFSGYE